MPVIIDGNHLTIEEVNSVARENATVQLSQKAVQSIGRSNQHLRQAALGNNPVYGVNTGFGIFSEKKISNEQIEKLNRNLIISHAVGTGKPLSMDCVKASMLVRANALAKGFSGVRLNLIETILNMVNHDVIPVVSSQGSLGSSGDLCLLAEMALVISKNDDDLIQESGIANYRGQQISGKEAMNLAGIERIVLNQKEGLALINGATFSAAIMALSVKDSEFLCNLADINAALALEALCGRSEAYNPKLHQARGLKGQILSANHIFRMIEGSSFIDSHNHVQDAYSLRCAPQVHGAARDTLDFVKGIIESEINAATDNPLIFGPNQIISGGNFQGEPVGMVSDFLKIAIAELGAISERRIFRLMDANLSNGLPAMLVDDHDQAGLNSGLMMLQYTAAALVLENQALCTPDSVHSLPTSANQEDHNANAFISVMHTRNVVENTLKILGIELFCNHTAMKIRKKQSLSLDFGAKSQMMQDLLKEICSTKGGDQLWRGYLEALYTQLTMPSFQNEINKLIIQ